MSAADWAKGPPKDSLFATYGELVKRLIGSQRHREWALNTLLRDAANAIEGLEREVAFRKEQQLREQQGCEAAESALSETALKGWHCKAHGNYPEPLDCDWPNCGCDPRSEYRRRVLRERHVERVILGLQESGWTVERTPSAIGRREADLQSALLDLYTLCTDMGWHAPDNRYHTITRAAELIK